MYLFVRVSALLFEVLPFRHFGCNGVAGGRKERLRARRCSLSVFSNKERDVQSRGWTMALSTTIFTDPALFETFPHNDIISQALFESFGDYDFVPQKVSRCGIGSRTFFSHLSVLNNAFHGRTSTNLVSEVEIQCACLLNFRKRRPGDEARN